MERIAIVMGKMHSGGKKNLVMEYYRNIDRDKIQFDFICDDDSNAIPTEEINELGGRVFLIPKYQRIMQNIKEIERLCRENKYKIIHSYNGTMNLFSLYAGYRGGVRYRISESISMAHSSDKKTILKNLLKPFSRMFATHYMANGIECGIYQFGKKCYKEGKVTVFKTVINADLNKLDLLIREKTRNDYCIKNNFVVGHIGRLTSQKNTLFLIDIFNEILKIRDDAKLLIIGDGDLKEQMLSKIKEYKIEDNVLYLGRREDIIQFYNAMDCFVLPSLYEGLPVVGVEAECCGLPTFFSSEIPTESNACTDLGHFIELTKSAKEWAEIIVNESERTIRTDHSDIIKQKGFDSKLEAKKLENYYLNIIDEK